MAVSVATAGVGGCAAPPPQPVPPASPPAGAAPPGLELPVAPFVVTVDGEARLSPPEDEEILATLDGADSTVSFTAGEFTMYGLCDGPVAITVTLEDEDEPMWVVPCDGIPSRLRGSMAVGARADISGQEESDWELIVTTPGGPSSVR